MDIIVFIFVSREFAKRCVRARPRARFQRADSPCYCALSAKFRITCLPSRGIAPAPPGYGLIQRNTLEESRAGSKKDFCSVRVRGPVCESLVVVVSSRGTSAAVPGEVGTAGMPAGVSTIERNTTGRSLSAALLVFVSGT